jgi:hypothetical protein
MTSVQKKSVPRSAPKKRSVSKEVKSKKEKTERVSPPTFIENSNLNSNFIV